MKRLAILIAFISMLAFVCACAPGGSGEGGAKPTVSMFDLSRKMLEAHGAGTEMAYASSSDDDPEELLIHVSDVDYSKVDSFFILYAADGSASADEIVVIAMKDPADVKTASESLKKHVESRRALYSTYEPELADQLENAEVFTDAQYAVLIISPNESAVEKAFYDYIGE
jgi:hypothetical protein